MVIDEEHRFGAADKDRMGQLAPALHTMTMSATPIPRSLQTAMVGIQEVSLLTTPPARRRPVRTSLVEFDPSSMATALRRERRRSGQSFFVVPRIEDIDGLRKILESLVPELAILVAHGKMLAAEMDDVVVRFAEGDGDILLSTNIIESGLDIPQANTIFIWRADRFGLAQLHQLRGRVGRGRAQGFAYLLTAPGEEVTDDTRARLNSIVELDRLGSGLAIAMRDLDLRGAGDLAGEEQVGHIKKIGTGFYQKLLADAVRRMRGQDEEIDNCELDLGFVGFIPANFVPDAIVRLSLYTRLLRMTNRLEIDDLEDEMADRFGEPPSPVQNLLRLATLRLAAARLGVSKLSAGPLAMAITFNEHHNRSFRKRCEKIADAELNSERIIYRIALESPKERLDFFEGIVR
jgi:transcription-repair coupling factor (superfamily II helicase)